LKLFPAIAELLMLAQAPPHHSHVKMFWYSTSFGPLPDYLAMLFIAGMALTVVGLLKHRKVLWIIGLVAMAASVAAAITLGLKFALSGRSP
jgi:hypothetical protein